MIPLRPVLDILLAPVSKRLPSWVQVIIPGALKRVVTGVGETWLTWMLEVRVEMLAPVLTGRVDRHGDEGDLLTAISGIS